jgi:DNA-binding MarR family transcriptional regulator
MAADTQASNRALAEDLVALFHHVWSSDDAMKLVGQMDLSMTQFKTLILLDSRRAELTLKDIAEAMSLSFPAASRAVDGLCQRDYVERREDPEDRRQKRVGISAAGAEVLESVRVARVDVISTFLERLPEGDRKRLAAAVAPIVSREEFAR